MRNPTFRESLGNLPKATKQTRPRFRDTLAVGSSEIQLHCSSPTSHQQAREQMCEDWLCQSPRRTPGPHPVSSQGPSPAPGAKLPMAPEATLSGGTPPHPQTFVASGAGTQDPIAPPALLTRSLTVIFFSPILALLHPSS